MVPVEVAREEDRGTTPITLGNGGRSQLQPYIHSETLDAALLPTTRFGSDRKDRLDRTLVAIQHELARRPLVYRRSGEHREGGAFLACSSWLVAAFAFLGHAAKARRAMDDLLSRDATRILVLFDELADPDSDTLLDSLVQKLSHLALVHAALALAVAVAKTSGGDAG